MMPLIINVAVIHESIFAKGESGGSVKSGVVDEVPAEIAQEVVFTDGERSCK
jgi:hypothetical protein